MSENKKVETFLRIEHGDPIDGWYVEEIDDCGFIGSYFARNVEVGETVNITLVQGIKKPDESGNFEYIVEPTK